MRVAVGKGSDRVVRGECHASLFLSADRNHGWKATSAFTTGRAPQDILRAIGTGLHPTRADRDHGNAGRLGIMLARAFDPQLSISNRRWDRRGAVLSPPDGSGCLSAIGSGGEVPWGTRMPLCRKIKEPTCDLFHFFAEFLWKSWKPESIIPS